MHIHEAVLSQSVQGAAVLGVGAVLTTAATAYSLRRIEYEEMPRVALMTSAFFVLSLIHVPLGITSAHLVLNGLMGLVLGWAAFPAVLIALLLQAAMFGHGGMLALGVNVLAMAGPAVLCGHAFRRFATSTHIATSYTAGFAAGALALLLSATTIAASLWLAGQEFQILAKAVLAAHLALAAVEGVVTGAAVVFIRKVRPALIGRTATVSTT